MFTVKRRHLTLNWVLSHVGRGNCCRGFVCLWPRRDLYPTAKTAIVREFQIYVERLYWESLSSKHRSCDDDHLTCQRWQCTGSCRLTVTDQWSTFDHGAPACSNRYRTAVYYRRLVGRSTNAVLWSYDTQNIVVYTVWVKKSTPWGFMAIFPKRLSVGIFLIKFYMPIMRFSLR